MDYDWRVEAFVESIPNPGWMVTVTHMPTGTMRRAEGKGAGWHAKARDLRYEIAEKLGLNV